MSIELSIGAKHCNLKILKDYLIRDTDLLRCNSERKNKIFNEIQESQIELITYENFCINGKRKIKEHKINIEKLEKEIASEIAEHNYHPILNNETKNDIINPEEKERLIIFTKHLMSSLIDSGIIPFSEIEREESKLAIESIIDSL